MNEFIIDLDISIEILKEIDKGNCSHRLHSGLRPNALQYPRPASRPNRGGLLGPCPCGRSVGRDALTGERMLSRPDATPTTIYGHHAVSKLPRGGVNRQNLIFTHFKSSESVKTGLTGVQNRSDRYERIRTDFP
jgi:hypothetical protein